MQPHRMFSLLTVVTIVFALVVIVLGAYTRLSHAGLGCPDWPGCYGKMIVPADEELVTRANEMYPDRPLETGKAWKEMIHRYAAGTLGLLILGLSCLAWRNRHDPGQPVAIPFILVGLVVFQALLGMWTVTLLLKPIIVMGHLLGGMTILLLLIWLFLAHRYRKRLPAGNRVKNALFPWAAAGLAVLYVQISLGGWTSANYAALVCPDLPVCQGEWWPSMDFSEGFVPWRGLGVDYEHGVLNTDARTAIHVSHRIGAVITLVLLGAIAIRAIRDPDRRIRNSGLAVGLLLLIQFSLGIANVLFVIPISVAVAHNGVASLLLSAMISLLFYSKYSNALGAAK